MKEKKVSTKGMANALTNSIIKFLLLKKHHAERISVVARQVNGNHVPSTMQKGTADISATIYGLSVKIEVKIGADKQSERQKKYQKDIENAGGIYYLAKDFDTFLKWYKECDFIAYHKDWVL